MHMPELPLDELAFPPFPYVLSNSGNPIVMFVYELYFHCGSSPSPASKFVSERLTPGDVLSVDVILKPESEINKYLYSVKCDPGIEWSIVLK